MATTISGTSGVTYPSGGVDNVAGAGVGTTDTQTLTNKTLTSPTMTTPTIDSAQIPTVSGTAPIYMCRAWVNFNGTGVVAISASGNVSSITDSGVGSYQANFTTAMPDANYALAASGNDNAALITTFSGTYSTATARVYSSTSPTGAAADWSRIGVIIIR